MLALDAKTGAPIPSFGKNGIVDLKQDDDQSMDLVTGDIGLHAAPVIAKDVIIVGAAHTEGSRPESRVTRKGSCVGTTCAPASASGSSTRFRARRVGSDTWEQDSESYTGNAGVWAQISVDEELNTVFLPVEMPTGDYYGGHRPGAGLFGESLVAVDLKTGKRKWHYQFIHHGIWDWDLPCAPDHCGRHDRWPHAEDRRAADEAGMAVRVRSRHRGTDLAD
jgi:quinoprotein glucose dehydrogenase